MNHRDIAGPTLAAYQPITDAHYHRLKDLLDLHTVLENQHRAEESVEAAHTLDCEYVWPAAPFFFKALDVFRTWKGHAEVVEFYHHLYNTVVDVHLEILDMQIAHDGAYNQVRITGWGGAGGHKIPLLPKLALHATVVFPYDHDAQLFKGERFYFGAKPVSIDPAMDGPTCGLNQAYTPTPASIGLASYEAMRVKSRDAWIRVFQRGAEDPHAHVARILENLTDDAEYHLYPSGSFPGATFTGKEAIAGFYASAFAAFADLDLELLHPVVGPHTIGAHCAFRAVQNAPFLGYGPKRPGATVDLEGPVNYTYDFEREKFRRVTLILDLDDLGGRAP